MTATLLQSPVQDDSPAEFNFSEEDFLGISQRIRDIAGIVLPAHKRTMVYSRIVKRLKDLGLESFDDYISLLDGPDGHQEISQFTNSLTTNVTAFFREAHHFNDLSKHILPRFTEASASSRRVRIWSAASSSGEEPYSIALTVLKAGLPRVGQDLKILATDLDTKMLDTCRAGRYPVEVLDAIPADFGKSMLVPEPGGTHFSVPRKISDLITFRQLNLTRPWPFNGPFDVIFCRNVLIYFDTPTKKDIVERLIDMLNPGGTLYLGHSESRLGSHPALTAVGQTIYRKLPE